MTDSATTETIRGRRRLTASLFLSLIILLTGMFWTMRVGDASNHAYHKLAHLSDSLQDLRRIAKKPGAEQL